MNRREVLDIDLDAYKICRIRGHVPRVYGNRHGPYMVNAVAISIADRPALNFKERDEGPWKRCFYCHKEFRTVVLVEEKQ